MEYGNQRKKENSSVAGSETFVSDSAPDSGSGLQQISDPDQDSDPDSNPDQAQNFKKIMINFINCIT
jgi:hypothetical protein